MKIYYNFEQIDYNINRIITLGTFDGVHKGHLSIIDNLKKIAVNSNLSPLLITIHPHPQVVLKKTDKPTIKLLSTLEEKLYLFEIAGLKEVFILEFNNEIANTNATVFVKDILYKKIGFKKILVGYDHNFGKNREGNKDLLLKISEELNFEVLDSSPLVLNNNIVSSSYIRKLICNGEIEKANELLGYDYCLTGIVALGEQRGRTLGFPTANISVNNELKLIPGNGVYIVSSYIDNKKYYGIANIGYRPTFNDDKVLKIEVYYLNFNENLYDKTLTVTFHKFIREEMKFPDVKELIMQINKDKLKAEEYIKKINNI